MATNFINTVATELVDLVRSLPTIYRSIRFSDPLVLIILSVLGSFAIGLLMSVRSPVVTLLLVFTMLVFTFLSGTMHKWLASRTTTLLAKGLITERYFDDNGRFVMAVWTFPMFCLATTFSLIMIVTLLVEISNQIKNVSKEAKQLSKQAQGEESEAQSAGGHEAGQGDRAEAAAEPAREETEK